MAENVISKLPGRFAGGGSEGCVYVELKTSGKSWGRGPTLSDIHGANMRTVDSVAWRHMHMLASLTSEDGNTPLIKGFFDSIPSELDESARVDGATAAQVFWGVVLPLAAPVLAVVGLFSFVFTVNEFIIASVLLSTQDKLPLLVGMRGYIDQQYGQHWGPFAAGVLLASIPAVLLFAFLQRFIVGGLTQGSVKG